jgi:hypothetical protein
MDETLPEFEIGQLSGLEKSEMDEVEDSHRSHGLKRPSYQQ